MTMPPFVMHSTQGVGRLESGSCGSEAAPPPAVGLVGSSKGFGTTGASGPEGSVGVVGGHMRTTRL